VIAMPLLAAVFSAMGIIGGWVVGVLMIGVDAGTYGHFLLEVSHESSEAITSKINQGDLSLKPGWVRWSLHPTTTNAEVELFVTALKDIVANHKKYADDYLYYRKENIFRHKNETKYSEVVKSWFECEVND
jgi:hypothetical protein